MMMQLAQRQELGAISDVKYLQDTDGCSSRRGKSWEEHDTVAEAEEIVMQLAQRHGAERVAPLERQ